jgi:hypothetical protein
MDSKPRKGSAVSTAVFVIIGAVVVGAAISLYLWSRWSEREADYEPEQLSEEEAAIYQLGTHLGWDGRQHRGRNRAPCTSGAAWSAPRAVEW